MTPLPHRWDLLTDTQRAALDALDVADTLEDRDVDPARRPFLEQVVSGWRHRMHVACQHSVNLTQRVWHDDDANRRYLAEAEASAVARTDQQLARMPGAIVFGRTVRWVLFYDTPDRAPRFDPTTLDHDELRPRDDIEARISHSGPRPGDRRVWWAVAVAFASVIGPAN